MSYFDAALKLSVVTPDGGLPPALEAHLDEVLDALEELGDVSDADYGAALAEGVVTFTGYVEADDLRHANEKFYVAVRTAIHAAKGSTASWPSFNDLGLDARVQDEGRGLVGA